MSIHRSAIVSLVILGANLLLGQAAPKQRSSVQAQTPPAKLPEVEPKRPECAILLPERDERNDLAKLIRAEQFLRCERDGFPKNFAPPWKTSEEAMQKLSGACDYFSKVSVREFSQAGKDNLALARMRCHVNVLTIGLMQFTRGLSQTN